MASNKLGETLEAENISIGKLRRFVSVSATIIRKLKQEKTTSSPAVEAGIVWAIIKVTGVTVELVEVFPNTKRPSQPIVQYFGRGGGGAH